ncbi:fibronectin type III domain-containing protein [Paenibacillus soyae]|uniref:chitinase n=1 Tax=Paenibacillus soyae TaxID=2969249 RepID=A0A9X2MN58_9BACL|nr:carbohydrate-binding protein [Paenibacillus soyae]MCR2803741.1 glycosyl hydrolase family 18 protein [Paenibacillus soyae]
MTLVHTGKLTPAMRGLIAALAALLVVTGFQLTAPKVEAAEAAAAGGKIIVGYWHNFDNGSTNIRLRDISPDFDVIQVAFAEPLGGSHTGNMAFVPYNATVAEFQADVDYLQARGQKVLISIGGANGTVELMTAQAKQTFVSTMKGIIDLYGFDGFDIDLEGSSLALNAGDTDFKNPTTPKIINLIAASKEILAGYGSGFMLTMAPETAYVQGGSSTYGGPWGAYLPVIHALRGDLDYLHVQHYNSGSMMGLDGRSYTQGTPDFHVALAEMLLVGFPVGGNANNMFPPLRADQIVIGLPASPQAAGGGYTSPAGVHKALDYLIKGQSYGGSYILRNPAGYPELSGVMTWSINWDKFVNYEFSTSHRAYLDQFGGGSGGGDDTTPPTAPANLVSTGKTSSSVSLSWSASTDNTGIASYVVEYGAGQTASVTGTTATVSGLSAGTSYTFKVKAKDVAGNMSPASAGITVTTDAGGVCSVQAWSADAVYTQGQRVSYGGSLYEAQWWTKGDRPDLSGAWGVWRTVGSCGSGPGTGRGGDTAAPTAPSGLASTSANASSVSLSWMASSDNVGVTGYTVYYGSASVNVTGTSAIINGLTPSTAYTFTVKARDAAGNLSAASSPLQASTTGGEGGGDSSAWTAGKSYAAGDIVTFAGQTYKCLQPHTSLAGWEPPNAPALWQHQ